MQLILDKEFSERQKYLELLHRDKINLLRNNYNLIA